MNLQHILLSLDFSEDEVRTYMDLLESGPSAAGALAKKMGVPRPSLYGFLGKLIDKGAVTQTTKDNVKIFVAERPEVITGLFHNKIEELQTRRQQFETLIPEIEKNIIGDFLNPRFEFFEGREGVKNVLRDMLLYSGIETYAYWPIKSMVEILSPEFFHDHNKIRIQNKVSVQAIWPEDQFVEVKDHPYLGAGKDYLREIRVAPPEINFSMGYWVYKNKAAFLSSRRESFGFIIESTELTEMLKSQHAMVWNASTPMDVKKEDMQPFISELNKAKRN